MAILKDTVVSGNLGVTDSIQTNAIQTTIINAPTASNANTFGPGTNGQVLKSNGTKVYWGSDSNSVTGVKGNSEGSYRTGQVNLTPANVGAVAVAQGTGNAGKFLMVNSSGNVEAISANGDYSASVASQGTSTAAAFTPSISGTLKDVATSTKPSGTDGTDYWTMTPGGSKTTGVARAKATATISTAGYIAAGSKTTDSYTTWNVTTNVNTGTAYYLPKATMTVAGTNTVTPSASLATSSAITVGNDNNGLKIEATGGGTASVTATATTNAAGYAPASTQLGSATLNASSNTTTMTKYITAIAVPKDTAFTLTATADTALDTTSNISVTSAAYRKLVVTNAANGTAEITNNGTISSLTNAGTISAITNNASKTITKITNSGTAKVISGSATAGTLTVSAYNASGTAENDKSIVSAGKWVATSVSAGGTYYGRVTVGSGSAATPATTITVEPTITVGSDGLITATASATQSVTPTVTAGYVGSGTAGTITVSGSGTSQLTVKGSSDMSISNRTVTAPAGYYPSAATFNVSTINVPKDVALTVTSTADTALDSTSNITVTGAAYRKLVVTNAANGTATITNNGTIDSLTNAGTITAITNNASKTITNITNSGTAKVTSGSATAGTLTVSAYNSSGTAENNKSIVSAGKWVATSVSAGGTYYGRVTVASGSATTPATTITANPTISVSSGGLITATTSATQSVTPTVSAGYIGSGTAGTITVSGSKTQQLTVQAAQTITPSTSNKTIASGTYLTGTQTIAGDANLKPENIKNGISIFGITGSYSGAVPVVNRTTDSHGGEIVDITLDAVQDPHGPGFEFVQNITGYDVALSATDFNTWTPSTTNTLVKATANAGTYTADMSKYEYIVEWRCWIDFVYNSGTTLKLAPKTQCDVLYTYMYRRPNSFAQIAANQYPYNGVEGYGRYIKNYYNSNGAETLAFEGSYGVRHNIQTNSSFSATSGDSPTITFKLPSIYARCHTTYMTTDMAAAINKTSTIAHARGRLFRCKIGAFPRGTFESVVALYNGRGDL